MLTFLIYLLTILLILDCLILGLLILIQLPKKEAGVGVAFGGGATDALFGAGSGNALSTMTKYTTIAFFILVFGLSLLNNRVARSSGSELREQMLLQQTAAPAISPLPSTNALKTASNAPAIPLSISTNAPAK